jgi:hypothetical protein
VQAASRIAILAMVVLANRAEVVPGMFAAAEPAEEAAGQSCAVRGLEAMLAPYAGQVVLSDVNDVPELLYRTRIVTVGSLYRNVTGFSRLRAAWRSLPSAGEPAELRAARVGFVLFCKRPGRSLLVADLPEDTLLDRLGRGEVPAWLRPVARDAASGFTLYKVVDPA